MTSHCRLALTATAERPLGLVEASPAAPACSEHLQSVRPPTDRRIARQRAATAPRYRPAATRRRQRLPAFAGAGACRFAQPRCNSSHRQEACNVLVEAPTGRRISFSAHARRRGLAPSRCRHSRQAWQATPHLTTSSSTRRPRTTRRRHRATPPPVRKEAAARELGRARAMAAPRTVQPVAASTESYSHCCVLLACLALPADGVPVSDKAGYGNTYGELLGGNWLVCLFCLLLGTFCILLHAWACHAMPATRCPRSRPAAVPPPPLQATRPPPATRLALPVTGRPLLVRRGGEAGPASSCTGRTAGACRCQPHPRAHGSAIPAASEACP